MYIGSFLRGATVPIAFNTRDAAGTPITFGGTPRLRVLNAITLATVEADIVPTVDANGVTGQHVAAIDTSDAAYVGVDELAVSVQTGTVDGDTVVGEILRTFSLNAGVLPANAIPATAIATGAITAAKFAAGAVDAAALAADAVSEIQAGLATAAGLTAAVDPLATAAELAASEAAIIAGVPSAVENADALLARNRAGGSNGAPTVATCLASGLLDFTISGTTLTVRNGAGVTVYTRTLTRADVDAIVTLAVPA